MQWPYESLNGAALSVCQLIFFIIVLGMAAATPEKSIGDDKFNRIELEFYLTAETHLYDRSVLFIGITGQGKSSLCNFLMKEQKFEIEDSMMSCPEDSKQALTNLKGTNYLLVDIPGVCDTTRDPKVILSELMKAFFFVRKQGISAIAVVIQPKEKMKPDEYDALEGFLKNVAPNIWEHVFVVFTHEKETLKKHNSGEEYIDYVLHHKDCPKFLKFISENCSNRFMHVECETLSEDNQYWEMKISEFTHYVESITKSNSFLQIEIMQDLEQRYQNMLKLQSEKEELIEEKNVLSAKQEPTSEDETRLKQVENGISETNEKMLNETKEMKVSFLKKLGYLALVSGGIAAALGLGGVGLYFASGFIVSTVVPNALLFFGMVASKFLSK